MVSSVKKPIHLAIVTPFPPGANGIGRYGAHVSGALARSNVFERITVLTEIAPNTRPVEGHRPIRVERLWRPDGLDAGWKIAARLQQLKPDVAWFNLGASTFGRSPLANLSGLLSPMLSRIAGLPSVVTLHEMVEQADLRALGVRGGRLAIWGARSIRFLTTQADVVCVTLRRHTEWLAARNPGTRTVHIPHGVFDSPELLVDSCDPELLIFGSFAPFKGLELLLDLFRELHRRYPSLRLTVAGSEHPRFPAYLDRVRHIFGEHPAVHWLGYVPEAELRTIFARATIVVLPYIATTGSSSVLYRAVGWGRPVVASDLPELRAISEEERLWIEFFPHGDAAGLAAALERLLADPAQRTAQAHHNYHIVMRHLTLAHTCQAYLRAFDLALASHHSTIRIPVPLLPTPEAV